MQSFQEERELFHEVILELKVIKKSHTKIGYNYGTNVISFMCFLTWNAQKTGFRAVLLVVYKQISEKF